MIKRLTYFTAAMLLIASAAFADAPQKQALSLPIGGTFIDSVGGTGVFAGTFKLTGFNVQDNQLMAQGYLTGTLTSSTGVVLGSVMKAVSMPATATAVESAAGVVRTMNVRAAATCPILHLDLGPLDLDLLGLTVHLNEVVLDIAAQTGAGNLLGNLLCAVTNLLNGAGALIDIANLLNQILQILGGLLG